MSIATEAVHFLRCDTKYQPSSQLRGCWSFFRVSITIVRQTLCFDAEISLFFFLIFDFALLFFSLLRFCDFLICHRVLFFDHFFLKFFLSLKIMACFFLKFSFGCEHFFVFFLIIWVCSFFSIFVSIVGSRARAHCHSNKEPAVEAQDSTENIKIDF